MWGNDHFCGYEHKVWCNILYQDPIFLGLFENEAK